MLPVFLCVDFCFGEVFAASIPQSVGLQQPSAEQPRVLRKSAADSHGPDHPLWAQSLIVDSTSSFLRVALIFPFEVLFFAWKHEHFYLPNLLPLIFWISLELRISIPFLKRPTWPVGAFFKAEDVEACFFLSLVELCLLVFFFFFSSCRLDSRV